MELIIGNECDFVTSAISSYNAADNIVRTLDNQRKIALDKRQNNMNTLRGLIQSVETNLWEALSRDFPKFKFRRQGQTIVINYTSASSPSVTINEGEVNKIQAWGVNDYYEAIDTVNRIQNKMWNKSGVFDRRWKDDFKRLGKQLTIIQNRNCKAFPEPKPGIIVNPPPTIPMPPNPPGPQLPLYPLPPVPAQSTWSENDKRNWSITGWAVPPNLPGAFLSYGPNGIGAPQISIIDGRELVYYRAPGTNPTKIVWLFHGAGGSAHGWFADYEKVKYIKKLLDAGYMVAAYESYNRISKKWTLTVNPDTNREIIGLKACQSYLRSLGILPANQYGVGMSAGGAMVSYAATPLGLSKVIIHNAVGIASAINNANYAAKTMWVVSANDSIINNVQAQNLYNSVQTSKPGINPTYNVQQGTKITAAIFDNIPNISTPVAEGIVSGLVSGGFINSDGTLTTKYSMAARSVREQYLQATIPTIVGTAFGADGTTYNKYVNDIMDQIKISFSEHEFSGMLRSESAGSLVLTDVDLNFLNG